MAAQPEVKGETFDPGKPHQSNIRVTPEQVEAAVARCTFVAVQRPNGSTSTFVHAFLDGTFYLATGHSACVDPDNYNPVLGVKYARERCEYELRNKLWELLGFQLYDNLRVGNLFGPEQAAPPAITRIDA